MKLRLIAACATCLVAACSRSSPPDANRPAAPETTKIIQVVLPTTALPSSEVVPAILTPVPDSLTYSSEQTFPIGPAGGSASPAPADALPHLDREKEPRPRSLHEQMERCLSFRAAPRNTGSLGATRVQVTVTVSNSCDAAFSANDAWFEIVAKDARRGVIGREIGRFQEPIAARGGTTTLIEIDADANGSLEVSLWGSAGGGRAFGQ